MADSDERVVPRDESQRLKTLREYKILDSDTEIAFDRITKLAADLFDVPIALVSLVDDCRQWFKSAHGLDIRETHRDISFCKWVVADGAPLVVPDARADPRFGDNPLVTGDPFIRFYAGVPLRAYNGDILGTFCIIDSKPRETLDDQAMERLRDFADIVMAEADLRRMMTERDAVKLMLERALHFSNVAIWQLDILTDEVVWDGAAAELWGADYRTALGTAKAVIARIHPDDQAGVRTALRVARDHGTPYSAEFRINHPELGIRWLAGEADWDVRTNAAMLTGINFDITDRKSQLDNTNLLMRELHHRMRNLFATVGAIISLTRHAAVDVDDYVERISNRLDALNRAQNVLLGANFLTGSIRALMREVEAAFPRVQWSGPDLMLPENALVSMALLFNELATNAAKHGALSVAGGRVDVKWSQEGPGSEPRYFRLTWSESGGQSIGGAPEQTSFGTLLMDRSVRNNLGGTIHRHWKPDGLVCEIALPARWKENDAT